MRALYSFIIGAFLSVTLAGCTQLQLQSTQPVVEGPRFPEVSFNHKSPIEMGVRSIRTVSEYRPDRRGLPAGYAHVEDRAPLVPEQVLKRWADQRLRATGGEFQARFIITEASLIKVPLPVDGSFIGWFRSEQNFRYDLTLDVVIEVLDSRGYLVASANSVIQRGATIAEDASAAARDDVLFTLVEAGMRDLDQELPSAMGQYLEAFVSVPPLQ